MLDLISAKAAMSATGNGELETAPLRGRLLRLRVVGQGDLSFNLIIDGAAVAQGIEFGFDVMPVVPVHTLPVFAEVAGLGTGVLYLAAPVYWGTVRVEVNYSAPYANWEIMAIVER